MCLKRIRDWLNRITQDGGNGEPSLPALANTFLFVEPDDNYLDYGSSVLTSLVAKHKGAGQTIVEIKGRDANVANVKAQLASLNPMVFTGIGHGNYTTYTVQAEEVYLQVGNSNIPSMSGKVVHLNSCQTGAQLGPAIMSAGALAFDGSNESFWFYVGDAPNATRATQSPFLAEYEFDVSLLKGKTLGEARADQLAKFEEELAYWVEGDGKNHKDASELARIININKSISVFSGEAGTTPSPSGSGGGTMTLPPEVAVSVGMASALALLYYVIR